METYVRETSIAVYRRIEAEGLLSKKRWEIYDVVFRYGPMTSAEAFSIINHGKDNIVTLTQSRARFTELREMGVLKEVGTKKCSITGNEVILWDVTNKLPIRFKREIRKTNRQLLREIKEEVRNLDNRIDIFYKPEIHRIMQLTEQLSI